MKTAATNATKLTRKEIERRIHERAKGLAMRVLKIGKTTCVLVEEDGGETTSAIVYEIAVDTHVWIPGRALAQLNRLDSNSETFEAYAATLAR